MAFPTGWGRKCKLTIQNGKVTESLIDFPVLCDETTLPSEMFDADGSYHALNGGGDIRFSSDAAGSTQLACEVVTFITDNDPANGKAEIWVKVPSVASATDTDFYVWYNKAGETQPLETDTYGKHNVWDSNFKMVQHMNQDPSGTAPQMIDSTSNSNDGTSSGSMTSGDVVTGKVGDGLDFDGTDDFIILNTILSQTSDFTVSAWVRPTASGAIFSTSQNAENTWNLYLSIYQVYMVDTTPAAQKIDFDDSLTLNQYSYVTLYRNGNNWHIAINAQEQTNSPGAFGDIGRNNIDWQILGSRCGRDGGDTPYYTDAYFPGIIDEFRISNSARSAGWITAEYNNQNDPATFVLEGTPKTPSGGTTETVDTGWALSDRQNQQTSWSVLDKLNQNTSWPILNALDKNTSYEILARKNADIAYAVLDLANNDMAWALETSLLQNSAWGTKNLFDRSLSWNILNALQRAAAWSVLNSSGADSLWSILTKKKNNTAWKLLNSASKETSWNILDCINRNSSWQILTSGQLLQNLAWKALSTGNFDSAWAIADSLKRNSAWKLLNSNSKNTAWRVFADIQKPASWSVLAHGKADAAWKIFERKLNDAAWGILSREPSDSAWSIINKSQNDIAWQILNAIITQDVSWQVLNGSNYDLAWAISGAFTEPFKTFTYNPDIKTFTYNPDIKTFTYNPDIKTFKY